MNRFTIFPAILVFLLAVSCHKAWRPEIPLDNKFDPGMMDDKTSVDTVIANLVKVYSKTDVTDSEIRPVLEGQTSDGRWPNLVKYDAASQANGDTREHAKLLYSLAKVYENPSSAYYQSEQIITVYRRALNWWINNKPKADNWWYNQIGSPQNVGISALMLKDNLEEMEIRRVVQYLKNSSSFGQTGQNRVWLAECVLRRALLDGDVELAVAARDTLTSEIEIHETGEGILPDWSFHQHGPQLQIGNYGMSFFETQAEWANIFSGTTLAFPQEKLDIMYNLCINCMAMPAFKGCFDFNALGRNIAKNVVGSKANHVANIALSYAKVDARNAANYTLLANAIRAKQSCELIDHPHYFDRSDFAIYRNSRWYSSVRMNSQRVKGYETTNDMNLKGYYSSDNVHLVMVDGEEYKNISATWNWKRLPGTTICDNGQQPWGLIEDDFPNKSLYVRGFVSGETMATMYEYRRDGMNAHKCTFFYPDCMLCLGSSISTANDGEVVSTVAQSLYGGSFTTSPDGKKVWHRGIGYINIGEGEFTAESVTYSGNWRDIATEYASEMDTKTYFLLTISHGSRPENAGYAYIIVPDIDEATFMAGWDSSRFNISSNTESLQEVTDRVTGKTWKADWKKGDINRD